MMRTQLAVLAVALCTVAAPSRAGVAQPGAQPQPGLNQTPEVHLLAAGRSYLGVDIRDITEDRMAALKLKEERGVEITAVDQDAPAGKAGLHEHDVILDYNGTPVQSEEQLRRLIRETPPDRTVALAISRDGTPMKINVQLADRGKLISRNRAVIIPPVLDVPDFGNRFDVPGNIYVLRSSSAVLGAQTENLTAQLGDFFGVKNGEGVLVRSVEKGSPADKSGLKAGDVIVRIDNEKLSDRSDLARMMRKHRSGGKMNLSIVRDKREQNLSVDLPQRGRDSSALYIDNDSFASLEDLGPQLESAARKMAELSADNDLEKAMQDYEKGISSYGDTMKQYKSQYKDWQKELEKEQKQLKLYFSPML
ncbi:MAG TPA: PDZ domain-containing protein [Candidatus Acidoferrales bacterium]|jgi:serine protease Do|nr:PDZ domain-containing protein [Candidatus Acidoferrales bacterium]